MSGKSKYWVALMYPENMIDDWEDQIAEKVQVPFAYCVHDKDLEKDGVTIRKKHVHIMLAFSNTTTERHALTIYKTLQADGKVAIPNDIIEQVYGVRNKYDYLIHDTEDSKKKHKHLYDKSERITGNGFDIGAYEQISTKEKHEKRQELAKLIYENKITNFMDFYMEVINNYDDEYEDIVGTYSGFFERLTKGNYQKSHK